MNNKYRILFAMCIVVLFSVGNALGSYMSDLINLSDPTEHLEEETPVKRAIEAGECDYCNMEPNTEPVIVTQTPFQEPVPVSAPKSSPGIGIMAVLALLSVLCFIGKKR